MFSTRMYMSSSNVLLLRRSHVVCLQFSFVFCRGVPVNVLSISFFLTKEVLSDRLFPERCRGDEETQPRDEVRRGGWLGGGDWWWRSVVLRANFNAYGSCRRPRKKACPDVFDLPQLKYVRPDVFDIPLLGD